MLSWPEVQGADLMASQPPPAQSKARFVLEVRIYAWHQMMDARCLMAVRTYSTEVM